MGIVSRTGFSGGNIAKDWFLWLEQCQGLVSLVRIMALTDISERVENVKNWIL